MSGPNGDTYYLARNALEVQRLELQNMYLAETLGYDLHPAILASRPPSAETPLNVADVATGTAAFIKSLASQPAFATSTFTGFDISPDQFPTDLPPSIKLELHDAKTAFPERFHGTFDIAHIRLVYTSLDKDDWVLIAKNVMQLLKPGGAIQWVEYEPSNLMNIAVDGPHTTTKHLRMAAESIVKPLVAIGRSLPDFELDPVLKDAGYSPVKSERYPQSRSERTQKLFYDVYLMVLRSNKVFTRYLGIEDDLADEFIENVRKDMESGAHSRFDILVSIGWKAA